MAGFFVNKKCCKGLKLFKISDIISILKEGKKMELINHIELALVCSALCLMVMFLQKNKGNHIVGSRIFKIIIISNVLMLIFDLLSWLMIEKMIVHTYWLHIIVLCCYYACLCLLPLMLLIYVLIVFVKNKKVLNVLKVVLFLPLVITITAIIINGFHPFAFKLVEHSHIERLVGYFIIVIWPTLFMLMALIISLWQFLSSSTENKQQAMHTLIFSVIGTVAGILFMLFDNITICPLVTLAIVYLYLFVQRQNEQELTQLAYIDKLTGLQNYSSYKKTVIQIEKQELSTTELSYAVGVIDINNLKMVNDKFGHYAGDKLISGVAKVIANVFGFVNSYRTGGDEFVIILQNHFFNNLENMKNDFNKEISQTIIEINENVNIPVSVAIGFCDNKLLRNFTEIFNQADKLMYENKQKLKKK